MEAESRSPASSRVPSKPSRSLSRRMSGCQFEEDALLSSRDLSSHLSSPSMASPAEAVPSPSQTQAPEVADHEKLLKLLVERGRGSLLRGWRRELDPTGNLEVNFQDFCRAAKRLNFTGDVYEVFGLDHDLTSLTLVEIAPDHYELFKRFRDWAKEMFGGLPETFSALDSTGRGKVTRDMFLGACTRQGFEAADSELLEIFNGLDVNFQGEVSMEEFFWLEQDKNVREMAAFNQRKNQKDKHLRLMAWAYTEDGRLQVPACNRKAQRPWLAVNFAELPMLINQKRVDWQRMTYRRSLEARITFVRHLRGMYGNEIRAWRLGLDPENNFEIDDKVIRRYCRKADLHVDTTMLWKSLDKDCDGMFRLEELSVRAADILASFQDWAHEIFGSCAAIWDLPEVAEARRKPQGEKRWMSEKKVLFCVFIDLLRDLDCPFQERSIRSLLLTSLDAHGCGFISRSDLEWLDMWTPPVWLRAEPDPVAWKEMRDMMMRIYKHPLKAWRNLLDADNSNNVSWVEFREASEKLKFKGNIGGAWRVLNEHLSSSISMKEYDAESAELLGSFKEWADTNFGSVKLAFKALETDGRLSYPELRRACQKLKYTGEVRLLFDCLDTDGRLEGGKRFISLKEVAFLDDWEGDPSPEEQAEDEVVNHILNMEAQKALSAMRPSSSLPALPERILQLSVAKSNRAPGSVEASVASSYVDGDAGSLAYGTTCGGFSSASRMTKSTNKSDRETLHRTYHCLRKAHSASRARSASRYSSSQASFSMAGTSRTRPMSGRPTQKLPWLQKILCIDDEMRATGGLSHSRARR